LKPDVLTLDVEMPRMDGLSFLKRLMHYHPLPVVVISSIAPSGCKVALEALRLGAVEVLGKPGGPHSVEELRRQLLAAVRAAANARIRARQITDNTPEPVKPASASFSNRALVVIGASTGGVEAIREVLLHLPAHFPPLLVVQHIPRGFSRSLAEHLDRICPLEVREAGDTNELSPGRVLIAPGDSHMEVRGLNGNRCVVLTQAPPLNHHRPSVDVLFRSAAKYGAKHVVGVLLTGMGSDGAQGLLDLRQGGARTIAQDEESSVVYGMPAEAVRLGAVQTVLPLKDIAAGIVNALAQPAAAKSPAALVY